MYISMYQRNSQTHTLTPIYTWTRARMHVLHVHICTHDVQDRRACRNTRQVEKHNSIRKDRERKSRRRGTIVTVSARCARTRDGRPLSWVASVLSGRRKISVLFSFFFSIFFFFFFFSFLLFLFVIASDRGSKLDREIVDRCTSENDLACPEYVVFQLSRSAINNRRNVHK